MNSHRHFPTHATTLPPLRTHLRASRGRRLTLCGRDVPLVQSVHVMNLVQRRLVSCRQCLQVVARDQDPGPALVPTSVPTPVEIVSATSQPAPAEPRAPLWNRQDNALELARNVGWSHLLLPGTPSTRAPREKLTLTGPASPDLIDRWQEKYRDREILWLIGLGSIADGQLAALDTDVPLAGVMATELLPHTNWTISTKSPGAFHRYCRLTDPIEAYQDRGTLDAIDLKAGWNEYVVAPQSPGYAPEPGFAAGPLPALSARQWNSYITGMKMLLPRSKPKVRSSHHPAHYPAGAHDATLCPNRSLAYREEGDHYRCRGESASPWNNFLRNVAARFVYRRWVSEGRTPPSLERTMAYMHRVHENNRCHEHSYPRLNELIEQTWTRSCQRASEDGYRESQARKGRLRAEQRWGPVRGALADRNRSIIADLAAGLSTRLIALAHGVCQRTVQRIARALIETPATPPLPHGGDSKANVAPDITKRPPLQSPAITAPALKGATS